MKKKRPATKRVIAPDDHFALDELVPMLGPGPGICEICSRPCDQYEMCSSCKQCVEDLDGHRTHVLPIALSVKGGTLANALWRYKNASQAWQREAVTRKLGGLTQNFLDRHEACLAGSVGAVAFDLVTWVPSSADRIGTHPLAGLLDSLPWTAGRLVEGFVHAGGAVPGSAHHADAARFIGKPALRGKNVLIVDDTWTSGANALSAARAARDAGARSVAVAVIGRFLVSRYKDNARYVDSAAALGFDLDTCIYCEDRPHSRYAGHLNAAAAKPMEIGFQPQGEKPKTSAYDQEVADMVGFANTYGNRSFDLLIKLRDSEFERYRKALASIRAGHGQSVARALDDWSDAQ